MCNTRCGADQQGRAAGEGARPAGDRVEVLRTRTKFDFSGYKKGTLQRRMQRRMNLRHLNELPKYVEVLRNDPAEADRAVQGSADQRDQFLPRAGGMAGCSKSK